MELKLCKECCGIFTRALCTRRQNFHLSSVQKEVELSLEIRGHGGRIFIRAQFTKFRRRWYFHQSSVYNEKGFSLKIREEGVGIFTRVLCTRRRNFHQSYVYKEAEFSLKLWQYQSSEQKDGRPQPNSMKIAGTTSTPRYPIVKKHKNCNNKNCFKYTEIFFDSSICMLTLGKKTDI